jgi:dTDP-4-dehydrorhamnose reductase
LKILLTGREGQVVRSLLERGRGVPDLELQTVGRPEMDLLEPGATRQAVERLRPDLVINAAAYTAVDQAEDELERAFRINADAAGELAAATAAIDAPVVQLSTDYVFDGMATEPLAEDAPVRSIGVYGRSKLAGEEQVRAANPAHVIIRTSWVLSPFGRNFVRTMLLAARERDVLTVVSDQVGSPTSALDLADALLRLATMVGAGRPGLLGEVFHVAGTGSASWFEVARHVMDEARRHGLPNAEVRPIRTADWPTRAARPAYSVLDSGKFARRADFAMPHWRVSVSEIVRRLAAGA